jgi:hypothetical protein
MSRAGHELTGQARKKGGDSMSHEIETSARDSPKGSTAVPGHHLPRWLPGQVCRPRAGIDCNLLIWLAIWSLVLVAWISRVWVEGLGALPLVEDRVAVLSLVLLAAIAGVLVRSWYWPPVAAASWIAAVGTSQLWMMHQVGEGPYLARWRVIAPLFVGGSLFDHETYRFGQSDLAALVIAGAALPALGAIIGVAIRRHDATPSDVAVIAAMTFAGMVGFVMMATAFPIGSILLPLLAAPIAGAVVRRWPCVLGMPLAWAYGGLLSMALGVWTHGIAAEWHRSVIVGEGEFLGPNRLTFGDSVRALATFAIVVILPAGLLGMIMARLTSGFVRGWGHPPDEIHA